jgi:hypothetical protein
MVNRRSKREALRSALTSQDHVAVARALALPPISETKISGDPQKAQPESLLVENIDYASVLTALLDACTAAEAVSSIITIARIIILGDRLNLYGKI